MLPNLQPGEMLVVGIVAVLLFGKRLPEVGRSLGKGIIEFKKGLRGIDDEFDLSGRESGPIEVARKADDAGAIPVPKFEPPTSAPTPQSAYEPHPYAD